MAAGSFYAIQRSSKGSLIFMEFSQLYIKQCNGGIRESKGFKERKERIIILAWIKKIESEKDPWSAAH